MNIQRKNSAHHFRMQSEREQTLVTKLTLWAHYILYTRSLVVYIMQN